MLSKMQKIWLWIFGAMFLVPEVLWGPLVKALNFSFLPIYGNVQVFTESPMVAYLVVILEIIGVAGLIYLFNKIYRGSKLRYLLCGILVFILIFLIISLLFTYTISNMHLL